MKVVYVFNNRTKIIKAQLPVHAFIENSDKRTAYIKKLHEKKYWIKCGCITPNAIMYPRLHNQIYQLVNDPVNGKHSKDCDLFTEVSGKRSSSESILTVSPSPPKTFTPVRIGNGSGSKHVGKNQSSSNNKLRIKKTDSIHSLLVYALTQAKLDQLYHDKVFNLKEMFSTEVFKILVSKNAEQGGKGVSVGDITFFEPDAENLPWKSIVQRKHAHFNSAIPLQAFIVKRVDGVEYDRKRERLIVTDSGDKTEYQCSRISHHYERTVGPRIVFIVNAVLENRWEVVAIYTHPIIARDIPILVDSNFERKFALLFCSYRLPELRLMKYYHGKAVDGIMLLPDFKMTNHSPSNYWSEIIEVMGMENSDEYVGRKKDIVPAMEATFKLPVREVRPATLEEDCLVAIKSVMKGNDRN